MSKPSITSGIKRHLFHNPAGYMMYRLIHLMNKNEQSKALVNAIQLAMLGGDMAQLGEGLSDVYKVAWYIIVANAGT